MFKNTKKIVMFVGLTMSSISMFSQSYTDCNDGLAPICGNSGLTFTASSGVTPASITNPGNTYNCLSSSPNPTWYYLEVSQSGSLDFSLTAPSDIDFIIYGPFASLTAAQAGCGSYGLGGAGGSVIDCSYSGTASETPSIPSAVVGQIYVLLITNYASTVQNVTFNQSGGTGLTDCNILVPDPCVSNPGTYQVKKNGALTTAPVYLCAGQTFSVESNGDYILPNDTIPAPTGDGGYTASLMWLVYNAAPTGPDPGVDPAFMNLIIPGDDISDINNGTSPIISAFGCGTYWFVPVAGDDGVGANGNVANGTTDNGGLDWDKNNNGCYLLGTPVQVTYACPITTSPSVHCAPPTVINGTDIVITGGSGNYTVVNVGAGNLTSGSVPNGGTAHVHNLNNNSNWQINITDAQGCTATASGIFAAPLISNITITPALTCPLGGNGTVDVTVNGTSGQGGPYTIVMASDPPTVGTTDSYSNIAGTLVNIVVADQAGCIGDSVVTITSAGHFIDVQTLTLQGEFCYGDGTGAASISATPTPTGTVTSVTWTGPSGQTPGGSPGGPANLGQTGMEPGNWSVTIVDNEGCIVTIPIVITSPQALDLYLANSNEPVCYGYTDGSITVQSTGGSGGLTYSWSPINPVPGNTFNNLIAGTYTATVTDQNGCTDQLVINLGQPDSLHAHFTIKDVLCFGESTGAIIVDSVSNNVGPVSYFWNMSGIVPNPPSTSNLANNLPIGTYVLTIQDALCDNQYTLTITQNPEIEFIEFGYHPAYCRLYSYQSGNGVVYASATGGVSDYDYLWLNLQTGATSTNTTWGGLNPGAYQMTVTDNVGCTKVQTVQLDSVNPIAAFTVVSAELNADLQGTAVVCADFINESQYFANPYNPTADTTFFWEMGYNLPWQITHSFEQVFDTCYYSENQYEVCLVAVNKNGCTDTACKILTIYDAPVLIAPNIFTPDGDGANQFFTFDSLQVAIVEFECTVYDRWGKEIFIFNGISDGWNGNNKNGKPCTDGVYFYMYKAKSTNGTEFEGQGTVHLVRG